jgi:hypothetical protein
LTIPLHGRPVTEAIAALGETSLLPSGVATRQPTLDDVYLRLTGDRISEAA